MFRLLAPLAFSVGLKAVKDSVAPNLPAPVASTQTAKTTPAPEASKTGVFTNKK
jgi:hypothetical protein